jgi:hypothetical protein
MWPRQPRFAFLNSAGSGCCSCWGVVFLALVVPSAIATAGLACDYIFIFVDLNCSLALWFPAAIATAGYMCDFNFYFH